MECYIIMTGRDPVPCCFLSLSNFLFYLATSVSSSHLLSSPPAPSARYFHPRSGSPLFLLFTFLFFTPSHLLIFIFTFTYLLSLSCRSTPVHCLIHFHPPFLFINSRACACAWCLFLHTSPIPLSSPFAVPS